MRTHQVRTVLLVGWLALLAGATFSRAHVWQSERRLWADASAQAPTKPRPLLNYGRALEQDGDREGAEARYREVVGYTFDRRRSALINRYVRAAAETNLAHLYILRGWHATAIRVLDSTIADWPEFPYAHYTRGSLLWAYGACVDARKDFVIARRWDPTLPEHPSSPCATPQ